MPERPIELQDYYREMERMALSVGTIDVRMSVLVRCEFATGHPLITATTIELRDWLDGHRLCAKTRYGYISHLSSFWTWALMEERATSNPTLRLTRPKLRRTLPRPISTEDLVVLIDQAPTPAMAAMVTLAAYAGLRCMEIARLDAGDILDHRSPAVIMVCGKGDKPRIIPASAAVLAVLRVLGVPAYGPVFRDVEGEPYPPWKVSRIIGQHMAACGVVGSAHQLRHSFGTEVYGKSHDLRLTQELLGHSSPETTAGYTAWDRDRAASVVAMLFT